MDTYINKLDENLFLALNGNHHEILDYLMLTASNLLSFVPVFLLCAFITIRYFKKQDDHYYTFINIALLISVLTIQYFICRYLLEDVFNGLFHRDKPCVNPNISEFVRLLGRDCNPINQSLFAYKPCLMFCVTSFLFFIIKQGFKWFKVALILWSFLVAYSRIYVGSHYPTNVLISVITGVLTGYLISRFYFYIKYKLLVI